MKDFAQGLVLLDPLCSVYKYLEPFTSDQCWSAYEVKNDCSLFERLFKIKKNGVFLFGVSSFVLEIFTFLYFVNEGSDDVISSSTKTVKYWIKNSSGNIRVVFFKLGTRNVHHKRNRMLIWSNYFSFHRHFNGSSNSAQKWSKESKKVKWLLVWPSGMWLFLCGKHAVNEGFNYFLLVNISGCCLTLPESIGL